MTDKALQPWRSMIRWFNDSSELKNPVVIRIADSSVLWDVSEDEHPDSTEIIGCVLPRLAVALSLNGSLIGLGGYAVQT